MPKYSWYTHDSAKRLILTWFKSEIFETTKATVGMGNTWYWWYRFGVLWKNKLINLSRVESISFPTSGLTSNYQLSEVKLLSRVWLFATPWTVAYQAPPSMEFSRQEYWSVLLFPPPGDLPDPGIEPGSPASQADALLSQSPGKLTTK